MSLSAWIVLIANCVTIASWIVTAVYLLKIQKRFGRSWSISDGRLKLARGK